MLISGGIVSHVIGINIIISTMHMHTEAFDGKIIKIQKNLFYVF